MKIGSAFPSKWISADDLQDRAHRVKINYVKIEKVGDDDHKPALYLIGKEKAIILNKTNANQIAMMYGDETDAWAGQEIEIYPSETDFGGKRVPCVRIRAPSRQQGNGNPIQQDRIAPNARNRAMADEQPGMQDRPFAPLEAGPAGRAVDFDDEIPFAPEMR